MLKNLKISENKKKNDSRVHKDTNMVFFTPKNIHREALYKFLNQKGIIISVPDPSTRIVLHLDITEEDVALAGGWPYPRQDLARIQLDLLDAGALGVGWVESGVWDQAGAKSAPFCSA